LQRSAKNDHCDVYEEREKERVPPEQKAKGAEQMLSAQWELFFVLQGKKIDLPAREMAVVVSGLVWGIRQLGKGKRWDWPLD